MMASPDRGSDQANESQRTWHMGRVVAQTRVGEQLLMSVDAPEEVAKAFVTPGQYQWLRVADASAPFAIASKVGEICFEYLFRLRDGSRGVVRQLSQLNPGDTLSMSAPYGCGYPVEQVKGRSVVMICSGTGIAPLRSVVLSIMAHRTAYRDVSMVLCARDARQLIFATEFETWRKHRIDVVMRLGDDLHADRSVGAVPSLNDHEKHRLPAAVFLCGGVEMTRSWCDALRRAGVGERDVFVNV